VADRPHRSTLPVLSMQRICSATKSPSRMSRSQNNPSFDHLLLYLTKRFCPVATKHQSPGRLCTSFLRLYSHFLSVKPVPCWDGIPVRAAYLPCSRSLNAVLSGRRLTMGYVFFVAARLLFAESACLAVHIFIQYQRQTCKILPGTS
jgi:hypothetical protein